MPEIIKGENNGGLVFQLHLTEPQTIEGPVQVRLPGFWRRPIDGCPHYHEGKCEQREMNLCLYTLGQRCSLMVQIIEEWQKEFDRNEGILVS